MTMGVFIFLSIHTVIRPFKKNRAGSPSSLVILILLQLQ